MKRITICHIVKNLDTGGMENGVINLCNSIDRALFKPVICCLKEKGQMANRLCADVELIEMRFQDGIRIIDMIRLAKKIKKLIPDIVHTHGWGGGSFYGIIGSRLAGVPVVLNGEHGAFFLNRRQIVAQRFLDILSTMHLSVSSSLKRRIHENLGIKDGRIQVIQNGVNVDLFNGDFNTDSLREELSNVNGLCLDHNNCMIIGSIGSLKRQKNQIMLLEALNEINHSDNFINKYILLIIGVGPDYEMLQRYVAEHDMLDKVVFLGMRDDIPGLLSLIDIVVSTSISNHEGLSNIILEAMSSGKTVISTSAVGASEIIIDGYNGFLVNPENPHQLCEKLILLQSNRTLLKEIGNNAKKHVHRNFSLEIMVSRYEEIYKEALGTRLT